MNYQKQHIAVYQFLADKIRAAPETLNMSRTLPSDVCTPSAVQQLVENGDITLTGGDGRNHPMGKLTLWGEETGARLIQEGRVVLR
ncbi:MAG TPA: hypothetical protein VJH97_00705 [Candidatus Nanoarchaeia archaeon]|nr:hypothetical protein [Candidatus Nanoarchaeia archaeon]